MSRYLEIQNRGPVFFTKIKPNSHDVPATDLRRWRLRSGESEGVHHWLYLSEEESRSLPQTFAEKFFLGLPTASHLPSPNTSLLTLLAFDM